MSLVLQGSTFRVGRPVQAKNVQTVRAQRKILRTVAAYNPQEGKVLDLDDMENSTGSWEMYGSEDSVVYPPKQEEFFERAAGPIASRKEALLAGTALAGTIAITLFGKGLQYKYKLPIIKGNPKYNRNPAPQAQPKATPAAATQEALDNSKK